MWDLILNPFVTVLTLFYSIVGQDIVLAIVVLTIVIRMMTYPLFAKSQESSKKMQELQPELEKLKEKYKNDREKLSQAQMQLYKEYGVNPLGGCLPMLLQFPILIGFYQAINFALASSPFELVDVSQRLMIPGLDGLIPLQNTWLGIDLTLPPTENPTFALVIPLLVLVTSWIQSRYTMAMTRNNKKEDSGIEITNTNAPKKKEKEEEKKPASQAQAMTQSMGTIMPLMFGFFSLSFSVGLSIYFITSNLVGIIQYHPQGKVLMDKIFFRNQPEEAKETITLDESQVTKKTAKSARKS